MIDVEKQLARFTRDLLNVDEKIIAIGRINTYDAMECDLIVVDNLAPAQQQSITKTYDGNNEIQKIDSLMLGQFTINFYGDNAQSNASTFVVLNHTEEARTLQKTYGITVFRVSQITNIKRLSGSKYDNRYEITMNVSYNITSDVNRLRFDEMQLGGILVDK
jgi:hypothetical protein